MSIPAALRRGGSFCSPSPWFSGWCGVEGVRLRALSGRHRPDSCLSAESSRSSEQRRRAGAGESDDVRAGLIQIRRGPLAPLLAHGNEDAPGCSGGARYPQVTPIVKRSSLPCRQPMHEQCQVGCGFLSTTEFSRCWVLSKNSSSKGGRRRGVLSRTITSRSTHLLTELRPGLSGELPAIRAQNTVWFHKQFELLTG